VTCTQTTRLSPTRPCSRWARPTAPPPGATDRAGRGHASTHGAQAPRERRHAAGDGLRADGSRADGSRADGSRADGAAGSGGPPIAESRTMAPDGSLGLAPPRGADRPDLPGRPALLASVDLARTSHGLSRGLSPVCRRPAVLADPARRSASDTIEPPASFGYARVQDPC
jgi:hypothetical protein